jgi:hypothetical protein
MIDTLLLRPFTPLHYTCRLCGYVVKLNVMGPPGVWCGLDIGCRISNCWLSLMLEVIIQVLVIFMYDCSCWCFLVTVEGTLMKKWWTFYCKYLTLMYWFLPWLLASKALTRLCSLLICDHELCFTPPPPFPNGLLFRGWGGGGGGCHSVSHHRNSFPRVEGYLGHMQGLFHFCVIVDTVQIQENFLRNKVFLCEHPSLRRVCALIVFSLQFRFVHFELKGFARVLVCGWLLKL